MLEFNVHGFNVGTNSRSGPLTISKFAFSMSC